jgi:hypothetical protein
VRHPGFAGASQNLLRRRLETCVEWLQPLVYLLAKDFNPGIQGEGFFVLWSGG